MSAKCNEAIIRGLSSPLRQNIGELVCLALLFCLPLNGLAQQAMQTKHPAQAKSQQERDDFKRAYGLTGGAAAEAAADEFSSKYPASELRHYLYSSAMLQYQREDNSARMLAMGEKVLTLDPDNPLALVLTATAVADNLVDHDRDRERKIGIIKRNAGRAIQLAETSYSSAGSPTTGLYKTTLQSMAYSALGIMKLKTGDDAGAEKDLKTASELTMARPDPNVWYHLALAQDHRKKYAAALNSVEQALQLASSNPELQKLAEAEHERLAGLAKGLRNAGSPEPQ
jgi:tetratricopeptide (TPR) repeat protein